MQSSLDKWFTGSKTKISHIFYLDWDSDSHSPNKNAVWLDEITNIGREYFTKEISWRNFKMRVTICSNNIPISTYKVASNTNEKHPAIPILKSNLQKCIRRGLTNKAIKTAIAMINIDFIEFIRRLTIIMVEDCVVHESISTLVWMTAAYPEWNPNRKHISWLLGIVKYLADLEHRDLVKKEDFNFKQYIKDINSLDVKSKSIIYSIYFRVSYGGLSGDKKMLEYFSELWLDRLNNNSEFNNYLYNKITPICEEIEPIKKNDIETASADFHCYPQMLSILYKKYNKYKTEDLKKAIWFHRSRKTTKKILDGIDDYDNNYMELWTLIRYDVNIISNRYLQMIKF